MSAVKRFVTEAAHKKSVAQHAEMVPQIINQLRAAGIAAKAKRQLEFFFATNSQAKAKALVEMLQVHEYAVVVVRDKAKFMVTGITPPIPMSNVALRDWSADMASLAFEFDALFDGWSLVRE